MTSVICLGSESSQCSSLPFNGTLITIVFSNFLPFCILWSNSCILLCPVLMCFLLGPSHTLAKLYELHILNYIYSLYITYAPITNIRQFYHICDMVFPFYNQAGDGDCTYVNKCCNIGEGRLSLAEISVHGKNKKKHIIILIKSHFVTPIHTSEGVDKKVTKFTFLIFCHSHKASINFLSHLSAGCN